MFFQIFKRKVLVNSTVNGPISIGKSFGKKALFANGIPQSGGEYIYMWKKVFQVIKNEKLIIKNCLVLGVGAGDVIREIQSNYKNVQIKGIEIDRNIISISKKEFNLNLNPHINLEIADAIKWVNTCKNTFDLIIVDLYIGIKNPLAARKKPFLKQVKKLLNNKGIIIYNCHYNPEDIEEFRKFNKLLSAIFRKVEVIFEYKYNRILLLHE